MKDLHVIGISNNLLEGIKELEDFLGFSLNDSGVKVEFIKGNRLSIQKIDDMYKVIYQFEVEIFKALAMILKEDIKEYDRQRRMETMSFMIDSSRNAVRTIETLKEVIKYLAILGFNELQIYTEDTYHIDDEPYFGTFRGKYSKEELMFVVDYAALFAIEVVPCIQTLAHLNAITCKPHYYEIWDCNDILLVDNEKTYELIEKMFKTLREIFPSKKVNVGLDEAHMLGLGRYLDEHGYLDRYSIFVRHLNRVNEIARKYDFDAMMWSDMFFRIGSKGNYYGNGKIEQNVIDDVPNNITLCYWDYDHTTKKEYQRMFRRHKLFNNNIRFTTATWNWMGLAPNYKRTDLVVKAAIKACKEEGINEYMLTSWGDNGSESSYLTSIPTLFESSAMIYEDSNELLFKAIFNLSIKEFKRIDLLNRAHLNGHYVVNPGKYLLFNDYFCGMFDCHTNESYKEYYQNVWKMMKRLKKKTLIGKEYFQSLETLAQILTLKCRIGVEMREAYQQKNNQFLQEKVVDLEQIIKLIDHFINDFRIQWHHENKTYGFDVQEIRLGGLKERSISCLNTLRNYLSGNINSILELEEKTLPFLEDRVGKDIFMNFYNKMVTHNTF